jgi:uncharacterized protein YjdB
VNYIMTFSNLLLVDKNVPDYQVFLDSVNESTCTVTYSSDSPFSELCEMIHAKSVSVDRIGIVSRVTDLFVEGHSFLESKDNLSLLVKELNASRIDFLACNTLPEWQELYDALEKEGIVVGASSDQTGNLKYGGNWVMENTMDDIEKVYFTKNIEYYSYLLDDVSEVSYTTLVESTTITNAEIESSVTGLSDYVGNRDDSSQTISLPSPFLFDGTEYSTLYIQTNGYISFTNGNYTYGPETNTTPVQRGIYVIQNDLHIFPSPPKYIKYKVTSDTFVVIFNTAFFNFTSTSSYLVKVTLYLKNSIHNGKIEIQYGDMVFNTTSTSTTIMSNPKYYYAGICVTESNLSTANTGNFFTTGSSSFNLNQSKYKLYDGSVDNPKFKKITMTPRYKFLNTVVLGKFSINLPSDKASTFDLVPPLSTTSSEFNYLSSNTLIATVNNTNKTITIVGIGTTVISAVQNNRNNYPAIATYTLNTSSYGPILGPFIVRVPSDRSQPITFVQPESNSTGPFDYFSSNTSVATVNSVNQTITVVSGGTATITARQTTLYGTAFSTYVLDTTSYVPKIGQLIIEFVSKVGFGFYGGNNGIFRLIDPISNSTGAFTYTSDGGIIDIANKTINTNYSGYITVVATQEASNGYLSASVTAIVNYNGVPTIRPLLISLPTDKSTTFKLPVPLSNSFGDDLDYYYFSTNESIATVNNTDGTITIVGNGTTDIGMQQYGDSRFIYVGSADMYRLDTSIYYTPLAGVPTLGPFVVSLPTNKLATFSLTPPTSNVTGTVTYTSSDTGVATVNNAQGTLTVVSIGTTTITATLTTSDNVSASKTYLLDTSSYGPLLGPFSLSIPTDKSLPIPIVAPESSSTGTFTYTSSDTGVATVNSDNTITVLSSGTTTITATQTDSNGFTASSTYVLDTSSYVPEIGPFLIYNSSTNDNVFDLVDPISNSPGEFTYSLASNSINAGVIDNVNKTFTSYSYGYIYIVATQAASNGYFSASVTGELKTNLYVSTLSPLLISLPADKRTTFALPIPISNSTGNLDYYSTDTSIATVNNTNKTITIVGNGTTTIGVNQAPANGFLYTGSATSYSLDTSSYFLEPTEETPTLGPFVISLPPNKPSTFQVIPPTSNAVGSFTYTSTDTGVASIDVNTGMITIVSKGTTTITATQTTENEFTAFKTFLLDTTPYGPIFGPGEYLIPIPSTRPVTFPLIPPRSNSSGSFTYVSSNTNVATVDNTAGTITIRSAGNTTITVTQVASNGFSTSTTAQLDTSIYTVILDPFVITFPDEKPTTFELQPPGSNYTTGTFTYESNNTDVASINNTAGTITIVSSGTSTITVTHTIYDNIKSSKSYTLDTSSYFPTLGPFVVTLPSNKSTSFTLVPPISNVTGTFTYTSSNTEIASITSPNTITILANGSTTIQVTQTTSSGFTSYKTYLLDTSIYYQGAPNYTPVLGPFVVDIPLNRSLTIPLKPPVSNSSGTFSYTSSVPAVAIINTDNTITVLTSGTTVIEAKLTTSSELTATKTFSFNTSGYAPIFGPRIFEVIIPSNKPTVFTITPPESDMSGGFTYTSSNTAVATITNAGILTIMGIGTTTINATQTINGFSTSTSCNLNTDIYVPVLQPFVVTIPTNKSTTITLIAPNSNSPGTFSYTSSNVGVATITAPNTLNVLTSGTTTITATQTVANNIRSSVTYLFNTQPYFPVLGPFVVTLPLNKSKTITLIPPISAVSGTFSYTSGTTTVATITNPNTLNVVSLGTSTITATLTTPGNMTTSTTYLLDTTQYAPILGPFVIRLPSDPSIKTFTFPQPTADTPGSFVYTSSPTGVVSIVDSNRTITILSRASTTITATYTATNGFTASKTYTLDTSYMFGISTDVYKSTVTTHNLTNSAMEIQGTSIPFSDNGVYSVAITKPFKFNSVEYSTLFIDYNGGIMFSNSPTIVYSSNPPAGIYPFHKDLYINFPEYIKYKENSDNFVVVFKTSELADLDVDIFFKITLQLKNSVNSGNIKIEYGDITFNNDFQAGISFNAITGTPFNSLDFFNNNRVPLNTPIFNTYSLNPTRLSITITPNLAVPTLLYPIYVPANSVTRRIPIINPVTTSSGTFTTTATPADSATVENSSNGSFLVMNHINKTITLTTTQAPSGIYDSISFVTVLGPSYFTFISDICFPAGTLVLTDQGSFPIETLKHQTIQGKKILCVTKTISSDAELICFEKNAVSENVPHTRTVMTRKHRVLLEDILIRALDLVNHETIRPQPYQGEYLYNVLLEEPSTMDIHGLLCETLNPDSNIAKFYLESIIP